jgi:hypothetical protein
MSVPIFDITSYIEEVTAGVETANSEFGGSLQVKEVEIVPDDCPSQGMVSHCAYLLAVTALEDIRSRSAI